MCGIWGVLSLDNINKLNKTNDNIFFDKFNTIKHRGPDRSIYITDNNYIVGFHRLSIIDKSIKGDQPFKFSYYYKNETANTILRTVYLIVNGEIYNWKKLKENKDILDFCTKINYTFVSNSDCEVILPMFLKYVSDNFYSQNNFQNGLTDLLVQLDGEFAFAIYDIHQNMETNDMYYNLWLSRDRFGIRPLFVSKLNDNTISFGSELKSLTSICSNVNKITQLEPRNWYYYGGNTGLSTFTEYSQTYYTVGQLSFIKDMPFDSILNNCRTLLVESVISRLNSDREIGCLLSGGLDSSLIAAITSQELKKYGKTLKTFSIGIGNSPDVKYAQIVAKHIGSEHINFDVPQEEWIGAIKDVIRLGETFDITTVRATTGQYLICKKISETTNIKVLLVGDGSDEATGGYLYFHKAPSVLDFHLETKRLLDFIHYYDVLRADRGVASNGLEARVPFLSHNFVDFYLQIDPELRIPHNHTLSTGETNSYEKYLLRKSFENTGLLPECVLWRKKEAFSDGVSSETKSWYQIIQDNVDKLITDDEFKYLHTIFKEATSYKLLVPNTKEAMYYRYIFEELYQNHGHIIPYYWMPNWIEGVTDPSARTLEIYKDTF